MIAADYFFFGEGDDFCGGTFAGGCLGGV